MSWKSRLKIVQPTSPHCPHACAHEFGRRASTDSLICGWWVTAWIRMAPSVGGRTCMEYQRFGHNSRDLNLTPKIMIRYMKTTCQYWTETHILLTPTPSPPTTHWFTSYFARSQQDSRAVLWTRSWTTLPRSNPTESTCVPLVKIRPNTAVRPQISTFIWLWSVSKSATIDLICASHTKLTRFRFTDLAGRGALHGCPMRFPVQTDSNRRQFITVIIRRRLKRCFHILC